MTKPSANTLRHPAPDPISIGQTAALKTVLRALLASHPEPTKLKSVFREHHRFTVAVLEGDGASKEVLDAYNDFLGDVVPERKRP